MIRCDCGSYAVNDDPEKIVCNVCFQKRKVRQLSEENANLRERCDCVGRRALEAENASLRAELATLRATVPYRVENQQPAAVEQVEWMVVKLECPE